jgi:hypothetical protein
MDLLLGSGHYKPADEKNHKPAKRDENFCVGKDLEKCSSVNVQVVVEPFGRKPVVMACPHNFGPKVSQKNDDNLVLIGSAPGLASECVVKMPGV